jgi:hypothetical protein
VAQLESHTVELHLDRPSLTGRHRPATRQHRVYEAGKLLTRGHTARVRRHHLARRDLRWANSERGAQPPRREVVAYQPLCEMSDLQREEFYEALLDAEAFEDLAGKWQAAILKAEENRPNLRIVRSG